MKIENKILVKILIPMLSSDFFTIQAVYTYPFLMNTGEYAMMHLNGAFTLHNSKTNKTVLLQKEELNDHCKQIRNVLHFPIFICRQFKPIPTRATTTHSCVPFPVQNFEINHCNVIRLNSPPNTLIKLNHPNNWLFIFHDQQALQSYCSENYLHEVIKGSGILVINSTCTFT